MKDTDSTPCDKMMTPMTIIIQKVINRLLSNQVLLPVPQPPA